VELKPRISDLNGKTICEVSDYGFRSEEIFPVIRESLKKIYPDIKFVEYTNFPNTHASDEVQVIKSLPELLKAKGCDAVISGVGG
jgi:ABC-type amino acid transport substrate-binding protein